MIHGFLQGFGFTFGVIAAFFALIVLLKLKKKKTHAPAKDWKRYLAEAIANNDFREAQFVTELIGVKGDSEEIKTPPNYTIKVDRDIVFEETEGSKSVLKIIKNYKILKNER